MVILNKVIRYLRVRPRYKWNRAKVKTQKFLKRARRAWVKQLHGLMFKIRTIRVKLINRIARRVKPDFESGTEKMARTTYDVTVKYAAKETAASITQAQDTAANETLRNSDYQKAAIEAEVAHSSAKNTILIFTHSSMYFDDRIKRQANALAKNYRVILFAREDTHRQFPPGLSREVELIEYKMLYSRGISARIMLELLIKPDKKFWEKIAIKLLRYRFGANEEKLYFDYLPMYQEAYRDILKYLDTNDIHHDIKAIIGNDVFVLPIVDRVKRYVYSKAKEMPIVVGDMHEVHFNYNSANASNQLLRKWLCSYYLEKLDLLISVSQQGADLYSSNFNLKNVFSIMNVPRYEELPVRNQQENTVKLVHTGVASPERMMEHMIEAMVYLHEEYQLYFHLASNGSERAENYIQFLKNQIHELNLENRVFIKETLTPDQLVSSINKYDIGVFYMGDVMANHQYAMPNKLFQYIMGRLAIVVSNKGDMAKIVKKYDLGIVPSEPDLKSYAEAIKEVAQNLLHYKTNSDRAASELCAEHEWSKLVQFVSNS